MHTLTAWDRTSFHLTPPLSPLPSHSSTHPEPDDSSRISAAAAAAAAAASRTPRSPPWARDNDLFFYGSIGGTPRLLPAPRIPRNSPGSWARPRSTSTTDLLAATASPTSPPPPPPHRRTAPASSPPPAGPGPASPGRSARGLRLMANVTHGHDYIWRPRY